MDPDGWYGWLAGWLVMIGDVWMLITTADERSSNGPDHYACTRLLVGSATSPARVD